MKTAETDALRLYNPMAGYLWGERIPPKCAADGTWGALEGSRERGVRANAALGNLPQVLVHALPIYVSAVPYRRKSLPHTDW